MLKVAILTPLSLERQAVMSHLSDWQEEMLNGKLYYIASFQNEFHQVQIILRQTGAKNSRLAVATDQIIQAYEPHILLLTGIAGGVKDVAIGDVVVGTRAYGYESGKEQEDGFVSRPEVYHCSSHLLTLARAVVQQNQWVKRLSHPFNGHVYFGPIASGDKVVAGINNATYQYIKRHYNDTLALEMEAYGVGQTMLQYPYVHWLNIRGISDLLEGKNALDDGDNQPIVANYAAAFLFEMLYQTNLTQLNLPMMDAKELSKMVFQILFPISRLKSVKNIGKDLEEATNTSVTQLWEKVKPLFIEEVEELQADPTDEDNQIAVKAKLKRVLSKESNTSLKTEIEALVKKILPKDPTGNSTIIRDSENVITGSTITAGGDFNMGNKTKTVNHYGSHENVEMQHNISGNANRVHIGNIIHVHEILGQKNNTSTTDYSTSDSAQQIKQLIAKGKLKEAIEAMLQFSKDRDSDIQHESILLASRWNNLNTNIRKGTVADAQANIEYNRIKMGIMGMLDDY